MIKVENARVKDHHRTMGVAEVTLDPPENFLRIGNGVRRGPAVRDHICPRRDVPHVPKPQPRRVKSAPPTNFALRNVRAARALTARRSSPRYVDTRKGDFHDLRSSGLTPVHVRRSSFGSVPKYLKKRVEELQMQETIERENEMSKQPLCRYVTQDERRRVLSGLRHNWTELQRKYQGLSIITDTLSKKMRKLSIESQLKQLEKDILLIEQNPHIYVYADDTERNEQN